jgi:hypothetical protein
MCVMSVVEDYFNRRTIESYPWATILNHDAPTKQEFEALKKEVKELKKLLIAAKKFDKKTGQPDCDMADKAALIKKIAELVGVDLSDVLASGGEVGV